MKPLRLEFSAFGPYPGHVVVDFAGLAHRGLFVIAGDTGTGKTTLFDVMLYALYGRTRVDAEEVRSHHADADTRTAVRFDFEAGGVRYVAERAPAQLRPKTRGTGMTTQTASALLQRIEADGTATPLTTRANDMTATCATLVGLDAQQFQRVVLLPQGEFSRFLTSPPADREALLTKLFGGAAHEGLAVALRQQAVGAREAVAEVAARAAELRAVWLGELTNAQELDGLDLLDLGGTDETTTSMVDVLAQATDTLGVAAGEADTAARGAEEAATAARTLAAEAAEAARRFESAGTARRELAELEQRRLSIVAAADAARRAIEAARVVAAHAAAEARARAADQLETARDEIAGRLRALLATAGGVGDPDVPAEQLAVAAQRRRAALAEEERLLAEYQRLLERRDKAAEAVDTAQATLAAATIDHTALLERRDGLAADLPASEALDARVDGAATALVAAEALVEAAEDLAVLHAGAAPARAAEATARAAYEDALHRFTATQAPTLARLLAPGVPCPVCGSPDHPAPASDDDVEVVERSELDDLRADVEQTGAVVQKLALDAATLHERLGADATTEVAELRSRCQHAEETLRRARTDRATALARRQELDAVESAIPTSTANLAAATAAVPAAETTLRETSHALEELERQTSDIDVGRHTAQAAALTEAEGCVDELGLRISGAIAARSAAATARDALDEIVRTSPFPDVQAATEALLDERAIEAALAAERSDGERMIRYRAVLSELEQLGVPATAPDVEETARRAALADQGAASARARAARLHTVTASADRHRSEHAELLEAAATAIARSEHLGRVAKVFAAGGATGLSFRQWVLGAVLDDVLDSAAVHLVRMSSGRYGLRRRPGSLDLEVTDAHTGRPRSVGSLSGGEQFQASLALALGLAEVIGRGGTASGHRYEALFVDEGFGSLDPDALGQAVEALYELQSGGRIVAVITHVEAMKQELHVGIDVRRRPDGRGSVLSVHP